MSDFSVADIDVMEGDDVDEMEFAISTQRAINSGMWGLQGSYGRTMMAALEEGIVMLGKQPAKDYYGNRIPSRDVVQAGTKGSRELVVARYGEAWAAALDAV